MHVSRQGAIAQVLRELDNGLTNLRCGLDGKLCLNNAFCETTTTTTAAGRREAGGRAILWLYVKRQPASGQREKPKGHLKFGGVPWLVDMFSVYAPFKLDQASMRQAFAEACPGLPFQAPTKE